MSRWGYVGHTSWWNTGAKWSAIEVYTEYQHFYFANDRSFFAGV